MTDFAYANFKIGENLYASFSFTGEYYKVPGDWVTDGTEKRLALGSAELTIRGYGDTYTHVTEAYDFYYDTRYAYKGTTRWYECMHFYQNWNDGGTLVFPDGMTSIRCELLTESGKRLIGIDEDGYERFVRTYLDKIILPDSFERITYGISGAKHIVGGNIRYVGIDEDGNEYMAFYGKDYIESINLTDDCYIANEAFFDCLKLSKINDNNTLGGRVGWRSFCNCISLTSLNILETLVIDNDNKFELSHPYVFLVGTKYKPVVTTVTGEQSIILAYDWERDRRILSTEIKYKYSLNIENHNNEWITIPLSSDNTGQLKFYCDDNILTCHLTDDLDTKYTGVCVAADDKLYQFKE